MLKSDSNTSLQEINWHEKLLNWTPDANNVKNEEKEKNIKLVKWIKNVSILLIISFLAGIIFYLYSHYV